MFTFSVGILPFTMCCRYRIEPWKSDEKFLVRNGIIYNFVILHLLMFYHTKNADLKLKLKDSDILKTAVT